MGNKIYHVDLTAEERERCEDIVKRRKSESEAVKRSQVLLAADRLGDKQWTDARVLEEYKMSIRSIERLRERFVLHGIDLAMSGMPRLNTDKIKFDGKVEAEMVKLRCNNPPLGYSSWSLSLLAGELVSLNIVESISRQTISVMLKKTKLSLGGSKNG
jgi:hypothetical protein